ncbi:MAG TPA: c-type cytochrome [Polyangiaceae bacterium]|nr:c-type cytochrome [Polyangiaceae bacterium]
MRFLPSLLVLLSAVACSSSKDGGHASATQKAAASVTAAPVKAAEPVATAPAPEVAGDAERGEKLVLQFECNRCHDGTGHPAMALEKHCTHCHEDIMTGRFGAGTPKIAEWKRSVTPYRYAPSLEGAGKRFRREWLVRFLENPVDLRPHLAASMPRLAISESDARDLAAYLTRDAKTAKSDALAEGGSIRRGRELVEQKGCGGCHAFSGERPLPSTPNPAVGTDAQKKAVELAPDLRHVRERFRRDTLVSWLLAPASLKADTLMPTHGFTDAEAKDVATYLVSVPLEAPPAVAPRAKLPLLTRPVTYAEVEKQVLSITCRHCHGNPDIAGGDGGPGNTGGFGFAPRSLDLSTYRSAAAGLVKDDGERHSLFEKTADGTPLLVAALRARQSEEAGAPVPGLRGMPLGLPAVSAEAVQLVESWIAQGRPQ